MYASSSERATPAVAACLTWSWDAPCEHRPGSKVEINWDDQHLADALEQCPTGRDSGSWTVPTESEGARPPVALRGKPWAVHPVVLVAIQQETLLDGSVDDGRTFHWSISTLVRRLGSRAERPRSILR